MATTLFLRRALLPWALLGFGCNPVIGGEDPGLGSGANTSAGGGSSTGGRVQSGSGGGGGGVSPGAGGSGTTVPPVKTTSGVVLDGKPAFNEVVRLTHAQWEKSIQQIFGLTEETGLVPTLYPDALEGKFSNNEHSLYVGSDLLSDYLRAAEELAEQFASDTTITSGLGGLTNRDAFIDEVTHRAFRRALTATEKTGYQALWDQGATFYASGDAAVDGARVFLEAVLQSPHFLYRNEIAAPGTRLPGSVLATKLSLLLKDTLPDEDLLAQAEAGQFDTDQGLTALAEQMLAADDAGQIFARFHTELYGLDRYKNIEKSTTTFPGYTAETNQVLLDADLMFFDHVYQDGGGIREILTSDVAYADATLARYYDITTTSTTLTEVTLDGTRPGFLTRIGFLAYNATLSQPDSIHRGVDINNRFLCADLAPPQGVIPPLPETQPGQTNRERVTEHTGTGSCANCHLKIINPLGFAFENFDALGRYRTEDNGQPIDAADSYEFTDGLKSFDGAVELAALLAAHPQTHGCYSASVAEFVLARDVASTEESVVNSMADDSINSDASLKDLVLKMIQDPLFTTAQGAAK